MFRYLVNYVNRAFPDSQDYAKTKNFKREEDARKFAEDEKVDGYLVKKGDRKSKILDFFGNFPEKAPEDEIRWMEALDPTWRTLKRSENE